MCPELQGAQFSKNVLLDLKKLINSLMTGYFTTTLSNTQVIQTNKTTITKIRMNWHQTPNKLYISTDYSIQTPETTHSQQHWKLL